MLLFCAMNTFLNLIEIFASVQGETSLTGQMTTFVRLARCNLRCAWCDTSYSFGRGTSQSVEYILDKVKEFGCRYVCVTGGEPLLQPNVLTLMQKLCELNYTVSLETGGSLPIDKVDERVRIILDVKCPGSQMEEKNYFPNLRNLREHDEVKFVVQDKKDFDYTISICREYHLFDRSKEVLVSPVFGKLEPKELIHWILQDKLPCRLNLQCHKYIWSPETKGV
ncbi:7-carboxy-7-deazaguanine synthase [Chlamydiales bacterium STE3]|nr:7-carboxy-7-deazaguanine synthase [Chlamydiales bacterium STE3]